EALLYDVSAFDHNESVLPMYEVLDNLAGINQYEMRDVVQRAMTRLAQTSTRAIYDNFGNVTATIHDGCVSGCPAGEDGAITTFSTFALAPGDPSGWLFREMSSYVTGSVHTAHRNEVTNTYSAQGKLLSSTATLAGTLPLDRFHASGLAIAPTPPNASGGV